MAVSAGCSASCENVAYDVDLSEPGAATPLEAIDAWRDGGSDGMPEPPDTGWDVPEAEGQDTLTLRNSDEDWVVDVARTSDGGWVVNSALANCSG